MLRTKKRLMMDQTDLNMKETKSSPEVSDLITSKKMAPWVPRITYVERELDCTPQIKQDEDENENFVTTALFCATEEGNLEGLQELLENIGALDINQTNKHGETALHMAASAGHLDVVQFLHDKGINLSTVDKQGDTAVYWAARQGHVEVIQYLREHGVTLNSQNKSGEAPIHVAARYGHAHVIQYLCSVDCHINVKDKEEETPLHCAAVRGNLDCVKVLVESGATLDITDKRGNTALHLACRRHYTSIALFLLHAGCNMNAADMNGDTTLHVAAREGILSVVQTLCAFGCAVDVFNKNGLTPLHLAAKYGHMEIVRCLLLSGANPDQPNREGVTCEIMAIAQGHRDIAELLTKLKPEKRENFMKQLMPTTQPLNRIKVKLFGHSGVGKSTLIESLKCGYIGGLFRRSRKGSSGSNPVVRQRSMEDMGQKQPITLQMTYEIAHENYTRGIEIQQCNLAGIGEVSLWEFSGYEPYYLLYDHFVGDVNCLHVVVFSLSEPLEDQLAQVKFWLNFIKTRIAPQEPVAHGGRLPCPPSLILVATNADKANCTKDTNGEYVSTDGAAIFGTVKEMFKEDFDMSDRLFVVDSTAANSPEIKSLKATMTEAKAAIVQRLPPSKGFLDAVIAMLPNFRKSSSSYPVLSWTSFGDYIRSKVNILASEDHLRELMHQLQLVGEVVYLETEKDQDLVVLNPRWLCSDVIGQLLSHDQLMHCRPTGCFTLEDMQIMFPDTEAENMMKIFEAMELCTQCELDGDIEYEFPCFNFIETLRGLWDKNSSRIGPAVYGGIRYATQRGVQNQLVHIFPRIQVQMRQVINGDHSNPENDLYQWHHGSKFCSGCLESLVTLVQDDQIIEVKARGPEDMHTTLYYFYNDICHIVEQVILQCCPGIILQKTVLSSTALQQHRKTVHSFPTHELLRLQLSNQASVMLDNDNEESFRDMLSFGSEEIYGRMVCGVDLHISSLPYHARRQVSSLLDPPDKMGKDWCMLAVSLGMTEALPALDDTNKNFPVSKTDRALAAWSRDGQATIAHLIQKLEELGRQDAVDGVLMTIPLYKLSVDDDAQDGNGATPVSQSSQSTISR